MKRPLLFLSLIILCIPDSSHAKSIARPGEPRLTFVDMATSLKSPIVLGTTFNLSATVIPTQNIWEKESVFLHLVDPNNPERILVNADFTPPYATTRWAVGEAVKLGPVNFKAPPELPPGKYNIQLGLYYHGDDGVYVREKYTNPDIKDWIVGEIEFVPLPRAAAKLPDLILCDFTSEGDLAKWQARGVKLSRRGSAAYIEYLRYEDSGELIPSAIMQDFFNYADPKYSDWRRYDILQYEFALDPDYKVTLQVKDKSGNRFQRDAVEEGGGRKMEVDLVTVGKVVDLQNIGNLSFFSYKPKESFDALVSNIKLIDTGKVGGAERAFLEFKGLNVPQKARAGTTISLTAHFLIRQRFPLDETMFIHFYRKSDRKGYFTADKDPLLETTDWPVGKLMKEGPLDIFIPVDSPPGVYNIDLGFFTTQKTGTDPSYVKTFEDGDGVIHEVQPVRDGTDYVREPYINPPKTSWGAWTVGEIEVLPAAQ
jgi:hypothetical protein